MIGVVALCLVANISGFHILEKPTTPPPTLTVVSNGTLSLATANMTANGTANITGDQDVHKDAVVAPREDRFNKTTGKKLKSKFKSKKKEEDWKPINNVTIVPAYVPETAEEKEKRLFAEFADAWKRKKENRVFLSAELDGLDTFVDKVNKARDWMEMQKVIDGLGEVGQTTLRQNPTLREEMMVPDKKERQEAAQKFMKATGQVKDNVLSEKMRLHSEFMRRSHWDWMDAWQEENADKHRRLSEYDETVKRRQMRGVPRRPLGDGEDLPTPDGADTAPGVRKSKDL